MQETTGQLTTSDGTTLFYRHWAPDTEEKGYIIISHGLGEHSGRYLNVVNTLVPEGVDAWALDHRGHGKSSGIRGHVNSFDEYVRDLGFFIDFVKKEKNTEQKPLLLGHSMGGLIAARFAQQYQDQLRALVLSSPGLGMKVAVPFIKEKLGKFMSAVWPSLTLGNELDSTKISHDTQVVTAYNTDPLVHDRVSARWFTEFIAAMEKANDECGVLTLPILMQIAGDDHLVNAESSKAFFSRLRASDTSLHEYEGSYHEVYNEQPEIQGKVLEDLRIWVMAHLS